MQSNQWLLQPLCAHGAAGTECEPARCAGHAASQRMARGPGRVGPGRRGGLGIRRYSRIISGRRLRFSQISNINYHILKIKNPKSESQAQIPISRTQTPLQTPNSKLQGSRLQAAGLQASGSSFRLPPSGFGFRNVSCLHV